MWLSWLNCQRFNWSRGNKQKTGNKRISDMKVTSVARHIRSLETVVKWHRTQNNRLLRQPYWQWKTSGFMYRLSWITGHLSQTPAMFYANDRCVGLTVDTLMWKSPFLTWQEVLWNGLHWVVIMLREKSLRSGRLISWYMTNRDGEVEGCAQ